MKKLLTFLFLLSLASFTHAQWIVQSFDNAVGPDFFTDPPVLNTNWFTDGPTAFMNLSNDPDAYQGTGSMKVDYRCEAYDGWGGYDVRTTYTDDATIDSKPFIDLSTGTHLTLRYKVLTPADTSQDGAVFMELKLAEYAAGGSGNRDLWVHHMAIDVFDNSGTWKEVQIPLEFNDDNTLGFNLQTGDGDGVLQLDKIKGFELTVVYITAGGSTNTPVVTGTILLDQLKLEGNRYNPLITFDNSAATWGKDEMSWNAIPGALTLSDEGTDFVEGAGALKVDYTLSAPEVWGGFVAIDTAITVDSTIENRTALTMFIKNLTPCVADSGRAFIRVFLFQSDGSNWINDIGVDLSQPFDWTRVYMPLVVKPMGVNDRFPPKDGFALKGGSGDFNPKLLNRIRIEIFGRGTEDGFTGALLTNGSILLDVMQQSGFQFADKTPPEAPAVTIIPSDKSNLVTWVDVPGETGESYYVYYSTNPITDVNADGVFLAFNPDGTAFPHGTQVYEHSLRSANTDKNKTYYYAVVCKDFAGNIGAPGTAGPVTNLAKGVPTVSITPPSPFVADGNIGEWSDAQPSFVMNQANGTANVVLTVDGDQDCSAELKVALDADYLYVMVDVTDDFVHQETNLNPWEQDEPDLYIGFYNRVVKNYTAYGSGDTADYQIRFDGSQVRLDGAGSNDCDSLVMPGANYYNGPKFPSGYTIEARIPLVDLATKRNSGVVSTDVINWKVGNLIPFDMGINDNDDGTGRQGIIFYSSTNRDRGYYNPASWTYTWISDDVTAVDETPNTVYTFNLEQNYPNPFNPSTQIKYSIPEAGLVSIKVFDILGREVADLVNKQQAAGSYTVDFSAQNLATGVYVYRIESGKFQATKKMMLLK